jgi:hypothetical protein
VYDNKAHRASAVDERSVLALKATKKPLSLPLIAGIAGLMVVIVLLVIVLLRGGGSGKKRGGGPPPVAQNVPPGYGGGYAPPPGYGMQAPNATPAEAPLFAMPAAQPPLRATPPSPFMGAAPPSPFQGAAPPSPLLGAMPPSGGPPPVVEVRCPACGMNTMATPGQPSICFSCGQPLPGDVAMGAPMGAPQGAGTAILRGPVGEFTIRPGAEVRVGRDPTACSILLGEPRVSGVHATLKLEGGRLMVRDETSNNGTYVSGARIAPGTWTMLAMGTPLRFGPVEFTVQLDG